MLSHVPGHTRETGQTGVRVQGVRFILVMFSLVLRAQVAAGDDPWRGDVDRLMKAALVSESEHLIARGASAKVSEPITDDVDDVVEARASRICEQMRFLQFAPAQACRCSLGLQRIDGYAGFVGNPRQILCARNDRTREQKHAHCD